MLSFIQFINESSYQPREDEEDSIVVHHSSPNKFGKFRPISHFGTRNAARERAFNLKHTDGRTDKDEMHGYTVRLKKGNTLHFQPMEDDDDEQTVHSLTDTLHKHGHINKDQRDDVHSKKNNIHAAKALGKHLNSNGIHTISYTNRNEDRGSTSYVATHPSQVRVLKRGKIKMNDALLDRFHHQRGK